MLTGSRRPPAHRHRRAPRLSRYALTQPQTRAIDPTVAGRWAVLPAAETDSTLRLHFNADLLMNRYGVLTRSAVSAQGVPGGFATLYKVLTAFEEAGRCQRGYFIESLGGAQFAVASTVDRLRAYADSADNGAAPDYQAVVLAAADPANPYGAALPWPAQPSNPSGEGHRPGRKAGALVVLVDGRLVWYSERGGRSLLTFTTDYESQRAAAAALADTVASGGLGGILIEKIDGESVLKALQNETSAALLAAGFSRTPRGARLSNPTR